MFLHRIQLFVALRRCTALLVCALPAILAKGEGYAPRVEFGARLEPGNRIIHGAGQDPRGFDEYRNNFAPEHQPLIYMTYIGLIHPVAEVKAWGERTRAELTALAPQRMVPQIGLNLTVGQDNGTGKDEGVAEGNYDGQLTAFADALVSLDRPVFIRIGYEFEGNWNNYRPVTFVKAWQHITQFLRARGVPFATVWCAAGASSGWPTMAHLLEFYPGDEWVDWWGVDLFSEDEFAKPQLAEFLDTARARRKPVMIGEMTPRYIGVTGGQKSWDRWYVPMLDLLKHRPEIKATAYINWEWKEWSDRLGFTWHDWGDARLNSNKLVCERWICALNDPIFLNASSDGTIPLSAAQP